MKYKLIALDLDGTLKNSENKITDETRKTLIKAQQLGATIVLASGRPTPGLRHEAAALELEKYEGYLLSFNGAKVMDAKTRQTMFEQRLTVEQAKKAYDEAKKHNLAIMTYYDDAVYTEDVDDQYVNIEGHINDIEIKKAESFKSISYKLLKENQTNFLDLAKSEFTKTSIENKNELEKVIVLRIMFIEFRRIKIVLFKFGLKLFDGEF